MLLSFFPVDHRTWTQIQCLTIGLGHKGNATQHYPIHLKKEPVQKERENLGCGWALFSMEVKPTNQIGYGPALALCHCTVAVVTHTHRGEKAITSVYRHPAAVKILSIAAAPAIISSAGRQCLQLVLTYFPWSSTIFFIWSSLNFSTKGNVLNFLAPT